MAYLVIRILMGLYFAGAVLGLLAALSRALFARTHWKVILSHMVVSLIWPLALFSQGGRKTLGNVINIRR